MQCVFQLQIFLSDQTTVGLTQLSCFLISAFFYKGLAQSPLQSLWRNTLFGM